MSMLMLKGDALVFVAAAGDPPWKESILQLYPKVAQSFGKQL